MTRIALLCAPLALFAVTACESPAEKQADAVEDRVEAQADAAVATAGAGIAALGLTEAQLLDADLVGADGTDLGDVELVQRGASGEVESLIVEVDDSDPDRYVTLPLAGLTTRVSGDDTDLQTTRTAAEVAALPAATLPGATTTQAT